MAAALFGAGERHSVARHFRHGFILIDPDAFEVGFTKWVSSLAVGFKHEGVVIDGKTIRRSFDHERNQSPLHVVSAWAKLAKAPRAQHVEYQRRVRALG